MKIRVKKPKKVIIRLNRMQTLIEGDVIEQLAKLSSESFDCIVTSPPYNLGKNYGPKVNDNKSRKEYLTWIKQVFLACKRVLTENGSIFLNMGYTNVNPWIAMDVAQVLREDFHLQNCITWVKNISIGEHSHGHFKPINSKRFINPTNEMIYHFTKNGKVPIHRLAIGVPYMHKSNLKERKKKKNKTHTVKADVRCRGNTWFIRYKTVQNRKEKGMHPASFPVELAELCIKVCVGDRKDAKILDPFVGTGSTLVATKKMGLSGTGIDINSEFLAFAQKRLMTVSSTV